MVGKNQVTIHDIDGRLNTMVSTVSRALNDNPRINDVTKKSGIENGEKLNYQPHNIAAALRNGKSSFIGIIVPIADRTFFGSIIRGVEEIANKRNYKVIICQSYDDYETEVQTIDALLAQGLRALLHQ